MAMEGLQLQIAQWLSYRPEFNSSVQQNTLKNSQLATTSVKLRGFGAKAYRVIYGSQS